MTTIFSHLYLKKELLKNLEELNFSSMTPIQAKSLPALLERKDVLAQAKTGSGKTAAFGLAMLNSLNLADQSIQSLVLCPTRELAEQVAKELRQLARKLPNVKILTICGGTSESHQIKSLLSGAHIVVGTPGRILHLLEKESLDLRTINCLTLDEADRMLDMGFSDEINEIIDYLPANRQTLLFSATYPEEIKSLSKNIQQKALEITIDTADDSDNIQQVFFEVQPDQDKNNFLFKILGQYQPQRAIVFCRTKKDTNNIAQFLIQRGISAQSINGDLEQNERTAVLTKFSNQSLSILVATDVAARGLDIEDLPAVINYNLPPDPESYIHRVGRTGRAGRKGLAFSFFNPVEKFRLEQIEELTKKTCKIQNPTTLSGEQTYKLTPPMKTMYISGGKKDKLRPGDIVGALIGEAKLDANDIGDISVLNILSYVAIKQNKVDHAIKKLSTGKIKKRKFKVGLA